MLEARLRQLVDLDELSQGVELVAVQLRRGTDSTLRCLATAESALFHQVLETSTVALPQHHCHTVREIQTQSCCHVLDSGPVVPATAPVDCVLNARVRATRLSN